MGILFLLLLIFILGVIILVHELGHFFWAKKFGVHIYEFSLGMGPIIYTKKGKDKIDYNIRAIPIGGFVSMAGEVYEDDSENKIPKEDFMCNKKWYQRLLILVFGVVNNFIMAIVLLLAIGLIWGGTILEPTVESVLEDYPMAEAGIKAGDTIKEINGYSITNWDKAQLILQFKDDDGIYEFVVENTDGEVNTYEVTPKKEELDGIERQVFGVNIVARETEGFLENIGYAFYKFGTIIESMVFTIYGLFSGAVGVNSLAGPIGMYQIVEVTAQNGLLDVIYLVAFLSINVGFLNILPFPAFDGGRILFLIIEKIKGSPINSKIENIFHLIGFALLMLLTIYVAIQDIIRLF